MKISIFKLLLYIKIVLDDKNPTSIFSPIQGVTGNQEKLEIREGIGHRTEHTKWLSNAKWLALKHTYRSHHMSRLYLGIYIFINE